MGEGRTRMGTRALREGRQRRQEGSVAGERPWLVEAVRLGEGRGWGQDRE